MHEMKCANGAKRRVKMRQLFYKQKEGKMGRLFYKPENAWVGDLIPYYENGTYYGFYLHDPRIRDKEYAEDTTWHLIETKDFVNLDYKGESIARGGIHDANKNAYTGSVIKCEKMDCIMFLYRL